MHESSPYISLLMITGLAVSVPLLASRFRRLKIPLVVGEIVAGVIVGTSGLNLIEPSEILTFLKEMGFAYLMFLSGLEIDFRFLTDKSPTRAQNRWWSRPLPLACAAFAGTCLLAFGASSVLAWMGMVKSPLLMSLILSTTSLGIVLPVLKEKGQLGTESGQYFLIAALVADIATLTLLTLVIASMSGGLKLSVLLILVLGLAFALTARIGKVFASVPILKQIVAELSHATSQIQVRGAFALMVAWVVLAEALGMEMILGAFLAGVFVSLMAGPEHSLLREKLDAIGFGFFVPIFFIMVGVEFNLLVLFSSAKVLLLVPLLLFTAYAVKLIPSLLYRLRFSFHETLAGGFLLSSRLSLIIAASAVALKLEQITPAVNSAVVLVAIVTSALSPWLYSVLCPTRETDQRKGVIIAGTDHVAVLLARRLSKVGVEVTLVSDNLSRTSELHDARVSTIEAHPESEAALRAAGAESADALVALTRSTASRLAICSLGRMTFQIPHVIARVTSARLLEKLQALGVKCVQPELATVVALEGALRFPTTFDVLLQQEDEVEVGEAVLGNTTFEGLPLRLLQLPGNAMIVSIRRDTATVVPHGDITLEDGDHLAMIGSHQSLTDARELLEV